MEVLALLMDMKPTLSHLLNSIAPSLLVLGCVGSDGGSPVSDEPPGADLSQEPGESDLDAAASCGPGELCLRPRPVVPGAAIPAGRIVVAFYQFIDDIQLDPAIHIGYDAAFSKPKKTIKIPLNQIVQPTQLDDFRLCVRECIDLADPACDCPAAEAKVTTAFVFVVSDANGSGAIEPAEMTEDNMYGVGYLHLGGADQAYPAPNTLDSVFPEGIREGLTPYRIIDGDPFDQLGAPAPGTVFELDVCVPGDASCSSMRFPNLT